MCVVLLFLSLSPHLSGQQLTHLAAAFQGELLTAVLYPYAKGRNVTFRLFDDQGEELTANVGFGYDLIRGQPMQKNAHYSSEYVIWVGMLAIASNLLPGSYLVQSQSDTARGRLTLQSKIEILPTHFPSYRLKLSRQMQNLVSEPSVKAKKESSERWDLIKDADRGMAYYTGMLQQPVRTGRVTSPFGERRTFVYRNNNTSKSIHRGHDFAAPRGTPVYSSTAGKVVLAKERRVTGKTIIVAVLPGLFVQYQHLNDIYVSRDDTVRGGQLIGTVGSTGFSTGPHLHQELYVKGVNVDPSLYYQRPLLDKNLILSMIGSQLP